MTDVNAQLAQPTIRIRKQSNSLRNVPLSATSTIEISSTTSLESRPQLEQSLNAYRARADVDNRSDADPMSPIELGTSIPPAVKDSMLDRPEEGKDELELKAQWSALLTP
ncbi:hypothetical protein KI688_006584 [Linnemannia hyalina]|uniref:Uncharacterized protein n=1 Tax=Linnemannia hyalina TaxID=64524 RepID=A0A9P7XJX0_9FUNG|nr:hypothetical protein KI688_006584 [Linnemannia hyalina]